MKRRHLSLALAAAALAPFGHATSARRNDPLRVGIDQKDGLRCLVNMGSEVSSQGTLSRAPLTRSENYDVHTLASS